MIAVEATAAQWVGSFVTFLAHQEKQKRKTNKLDMFPDEIVSGELSKLFLGTIDF